MTQSDKEVGQAFDKYVTPAIRARSPLDTVALWEARMRLPLDAVGLWEAQMRLAIAARSTGARATYEVCEATLTFLEDYIGDSNLQKARSSILEAIDW